MLTTCAESFIAGLDELKPLLPIHWEKLALDKEAVPLDPDYEVYFERERRGQLLYMTLRDQGRLVGYWIAFIAPGLHYRTCLTATLDIWNLLPGYETGLAARLLMRSIEKEYKRRGVQRSIVGEKLKLPTGKLFRAFGYRQIEAYWSKLYEV